ncbi:MAG: tRNA-dihydrouridine synthase, partial [Gemmatimonadota bacterium]
EQAGARVLTLHARTRTEMYSGHSDWSEIRAVAEALEIPVVGNGDVRSGEDARRMREETGCAGIMIARGSHGAPWLFREARAALDGAPIPDPPDVRERFEIAVEHARNAIAFEADERRAMLEFRKHLGWYTKGLPEGRTLRQELFQVSTLREMEERLSGYLAGAPVAA